MGEADLVNIRTDYWALNEAVNKLLEGKDRKDQTNWMSEIKRSLATAVVMFPESARFRWVFVTLVRLMNLGQTCPPTFVKPWMPKMIHSWEDMSKIAAGSKVDGTNPPVDKDYQYTADDVGKALEFCNWADDALVVHCLIKVPVETLRRKRTQGIWWVTVKLADSAGNEENICEEWSNLKKKFPDYDDGYRYN
ncbi:hypothetical protein CTI12_AA000400 [Artemisia annua]|uniref:rRNA N-glycosylase n=1 Tax=Artemisia annua TaxID=35608 RepID=A0A2U1QJP5_ARTAN|nr:hypothetical protein CTI12_AA000400 [Artemisia annua]